MKYIRYNNRPPHYFLDNTYYFIVAKTLRAIHFFNTDKRKIILLKIIDSTLKEFDYTCQSYVILNNHYQLIINIKKGMNLPKFIQKVHGRSSIGLNRLDDIHGRKVWWNYWDKCLETEKDFWMHVNYNHHNPVKHGYVKRMGDYRFSSYNQYIKKFTKDFIYERLSKYPIIDYSLNDEFYGESIELAS